MRFLLLAFLFPVFLFGQQSRINIKHLQGVDAGGQTGAVMSLGGSDVPTWNNDLIWNAGTFEVEGDVRVNGALSTTLDVGIGTSNPEVLLHLSSPNPFVYLSDTDAGNVNTIGLISSGGNFTLNLKDQNGGHLSTIYQSVNNATGSEYQRWFTSGVERLRINSIGSAQFNYGSNQGISIEAPSTALQTIRINSTDFRFFSGVAGNLLWLKGSTGNVGINTIDPSQRLDVDGNLRVRGAIYDALNSPGGGTSVLTGGTTTAVWKTVDQLFSNIATGPLSATGDYTHSWNDYQLHINDIADLVMTVDAGTRTGVFQLDDQLIYYVKDASNNERAGIQASTPRIFNGGVWDLSFQAGVQAYYDGSTAKAFLNTGQTGVTTGALAQYYDEAQDRTAYSPYILPTTGPGRKNQIAYSTDANTFIFGPGIPWENVSPGTITNDTPKVVGTTSGTYTLPPNPSNGQPQLIKTIGSSTVAGNGSDTIDGAASISTSANTCLWLEFSGGEWSVVSRFN